MKIVTNNQPKTRTYFQLVLSFLGSTTNSYSCEKFETEQDARDFFIKDFKNRNENDGYDAHWNAKGLVIQKVTITEELVVDDRTPEEIALCYVHHIGKGDGWKYLFNGSWSGSFENKKDCIYYFIKFYLTA